MSLANKKHIKGSALITAMAVLLTGCSAGERLANIGSPPAMSRIENPAEEKQYRSISMPMPEVKTVAPENNSLWSGGSRQTFFDDQRANDIGDILTVMIDIDDQAQLESETDRSRSANESAGLNSLLGLETKLAGLIDENLNTESLVDGETDSDYRGQGSTEREEQVEMKLAATVTQILPNGNMLIQGRQEVRVNFEKRILELAGIIRPEDITVDNSIPYEKIAEARISYGGKGQITDVQQPRYGQQVYDVLFPF